MNLSISVNHYSIIVLSKLMFRFGPTVLISLALPVVDMVALAYLNDCMRSCLLGYLHVLLVLPAYYSTGTALIKVLIL